MMKSEDSEAPGSLGSLQSRPGNRDYGDYDDDEIMEDGTKYKGDSPDHNHNHRDLEESRVMGESHGSRRGSADANLHHLVKNDQRRRSSISRSRSFKDEHSPSRSPSSSYSRHSRRRSSNNINNHNTITNDGNNAGGSTKQQQRNNISSIGGIDVVEIADEDASFILGSAGRTKKKLSRVCGAELNIKQQDSSTILEIRGSSEARERAKIYVDFVMQQRIGPVRLKPEQRNREDLTCIKVPHECVGYVTGKKGLGLRSIEKEWGTLMFFTDLRQDKQGETENLAILAPDARKRRGAELKVMSAVEQKMPGHYTKDIVEFIDETDGFGTDYVPIKDDDYSYALGKEGATRKKLARASGAILEYVGRIAFISGNKAERTRAREYLQWLCLQRMSYVHVDEEGRTDCIVAAVPSNCVAYVTGSKGSSLRRIEDISGTFIFLDGTSRGREEEKLLIFGHDHDGRCYARQLVLERIQERLTGRSSNYRGFYGGNNPYWTGSRSDGRRDGRHWWSAYDNSRRYYNNRNSRGGEYTPSRGSEHGNERYYDNNRSRSYAATSSVRDHRDAPYHHYHHPSSPSSYAPAATNSGYDDRYGRRDCGDYAAGSCHVSNRPAAAASSYDRSRDHRYENSRTVGRAADTRYNERSDSRRYTGEYYNRR